MSEKVKVGNLVSCGPGTRCLAMHEPLGDVGNENWTGDFTFGLCLGNCRRSSSKNSGRDAYAFVIDSRTLHYGWVRMNELSVVQESK